MEIFIYPIFTDKVQGIYSSSLEVFQGRHRLNWSAIKESNRILNQLFKFRRVEYVF